MRSANATLGNFLGTLFAKAAPFAVILIAGFPCNSLAQQTGQNTYATAEEASQALFTAAQSGEKALLEVLGPDGKQIVSSGDPTEDAANRTNFVQKFQVMHRLVKEPDGSTTLYIGAENWPTPIPLADKGGRWYFNTDAGKQEILFRRIGQNELSAIRVCEELVAAETEYHSKQNNEYAEKFVSDEGKHNGLYWAGADNKDESPIGPLVANAGNDGATAKSATAGPVPFRGYYFRILERQGKDAAGGAMDYVADGKMTKGFAFEAYPAVYRDSGVMTFIVDQDGVVYEKDLGKQTVVRATHMRAYEPDSTWQKSAEETEESAGNQKAQ